MATTMFPPRGRAAVPHTRGIVAVLATLLASWRYAGGRRDLRLDLLRGLAVVAMVTDHVGGEESWLYIFTGGNHFWTSAAEGFIFISGLAMGIVYPAVIAREGIGAAVKKALRRAGTLYLLTVTLTLTTAALAFRLGVQWAPQVATNALPDFVVGVLTLHRSYYLTDVLLLYTLVIFIATGALYLMATRRSWIVLAASWGLWSLWQFFPQQATLPWAITDNSVFNLSAWQLLFFNGLLIGFYRETLAAHFGWLTSRAALTVSGSLFAVSLAVYNDGMAPLVAFTGKDAAWLDAHVFSKSDQQFGRIISFAIVAVFAVSFVTNCWQPLVRGLGWLLLPLGQSALLAYGLHLFVIMLTTLAGPHLFCGGIFTAAQNAALQAGGILLIWMVVRVRPRLVAFVGNGLTSCPPAACARAPVPSGTARLRGGRAIDAQGCCRSR